jgi:hypothetical protein
MPTELERRARDRRVAEVTSVPMDTMDRLLTGRATEGDQMLAYNALAALQAQHPATILGSTADELFTALEGAHDLGGPAHERIKILVQQRCVAQQPGAQAVGTLTIEHFRGSAAMENFDLDYFGTLAPGSYAIFTHPQPPSIPEPSEADVRASMEAYDMAIPGIGPTASSTVARIRAALTTYTARLRERIGGAK